MKEVVYLPQLDRLVVVNENTVSVGIDRHGIFHDTRQRVAVCSVCDGVPTGDDSPCPRCGGAPKPRAELIGKRVFVE